MSRDKQIADMADILCEAKGHNCEGGDDCRCIKQAEALYNAGYRKASDVAREIFEDIRANCVDSDGHFLYGAFMNLRLDTMKKYTKEITEGGE